MSKDIRYKIDKENRVIVCTISGCSNIVLDRIYKYMPHFSSYGDYNRFEIRDRYTGIAKCAPKDEWDEEYGKRLALTRAKIKRCKDINKTVKGTVRMLARECSKLETYGIHELPDEKDI